MIVLPKTGDLISGRFRITELIGSGGLGAVYKAEQLDARRTVAIKFLHPHIAQLEELSERFLREAQILSKLCHPNIVTVYHMGSLQQGLPYIVMEYVKGKNARQLLIETGRLSTIRALKIIRDSAKALQEVHQLGAVHRDIKLDNIVLLDTPEPDTVKIIDFGLASLNDRDQQKLTSTGELIGTVDYMSPEQCKGQKVDKRSDIYALTICLYELLTGKKPFSADTPVGLIYQHTNSPRPDLKSNETDRYSKRLKNLIMIWSIIDSCHCKRSNCVAPAQCQANKLIQSSEKNCWHLCQQS